MDNNSSNNAGGWIGQPAQSATTQPFQSTSASQPIQSAGAQPMGFGSGPIQNNNATSMAPVTNTSQMNAAAGTASLINGGQMGIQSPINSQPIITPQVKPTPNHKSKTGIVIGVCAAVLALCALGAYLLSSPSPQNTAEQANFAEFSPLELPDDIDETIFISGLTDNRFFIDTTNPKNTLDGKTIEKEYISIGLGPDYPDAGFLILDFDYSISRGFSVSDFQIAPEFEKYYDVSFNGEHVRLVYNGPEDDEVIHDLPDDFLSFHVDGPNEDYVTFLIENLSLVSINAETHKKTLYKLEDNDFFDINTLNYSIDASSLGDDRLITIPFPSSDGATVSLSIPDNLFNVTYVIDDGVEIYGSTSTKIFDFADPFKNYSAPATLRFSKGSTYYGKSPVLEHNGYYIYLHLSYYEPKIYSENFQEESKALNDTIKYLENFLSDPNNYTFSD